VQKVAVESYDDRIDSSRSLVGMKRSRIQTPWFVMRELQNEKLIDQLHGGIWTIR